MFNPDILKQESKHRLAEREYQKSIKILHLAIPLLSLFAILNLYRGNELQGWIEAGVVVCFIVFRILMSRGLSLIFVDAAFALLCLGIFIGIFMNGGYHGTGILWVAGLPFIGFYLLGIRLGFYWCIITAIAVGILLILDHQGMVALAYSREYLHVYLAVLFFYGACGWYSESAHLKSQINLISANKRVLEEQQNREYMESHLQNLIDAMDEVYFRIDSEGNIENISDSILAISGYESGEMIGRPIINFYADTSQRDAYMAEICRHGFVKGYELEMLAKDGSRRFISANTRLIKDEHGNILGHEGLFHDITARKKAEMALLEANKELQKARDEAVRGNEAKTEFLSVISHELRTPLHGIIGMHDLLAEMKEMPLEQRRNLAAAQQAARSLRTLVNDVLDLSKIEAGAMELVEREVELESCIREALTPFIFSAREKGLQFELIMQDVPGMLMVDPVRLRQVVLNLAGNAVKFTDRGYVRLHVMQQQERQQLVFTVEDSGIGIAGEDIDTIFEPFSQIHSLMDEKHEGTGLGTTIVKRFVELMGGDVWVRSKPGKGSAFGFSIPCNPVGDETISRHIDMLEMVIDPSDDDALSHQMTFHQQWKVLLVEDDPITQRVATRQLERAGLEVDVAGNGLLALEMIRNGNYQVVLMDIRMPGMDGISVTRKVREMEAGRGVHLPIIGLSAHAFEEVQQECEEAGMDDFLVKPVDPKTVLSRIMLQIEADSGTSE